MKAYVMTTGVLFGLLTIAHVLRAVEEGSHLAREPFFVVVTLLAAGLSAWALRLVTLSKRQHM